MEYLAREEGRRWIALAHEVADERTPPSVLAILAFGEATVAMMLRDYHRQLAKSERAIMGYRAIGDPLGTARAQDSAILCSLRSGTCGGVSGSSDAALDFACRGGYQISPQARCATALE